METQYLTDESGRRVAAVVDIDRYEALLDALDELEDLRAVDAATARREEAIPFEQAVREIEAART